MSRLRGRGFRALPLAPGGHPRYNSIILTDAGTHFSEWLSNAWAVLALFVLPVGGGIPGGVLLAKSRGLWWPTVAALYFVSDLLLAVAFEPLMMAFISVGQRSERVAKIVAAMKVAMAKTLPALARRPGAFALIWLSFAADPMTGRAAARAAGHGFVSGWTLAIAGDMVYFFMIMASTLFLSGILGDGTYATVIILVLSMGVSYLARHPWVSQLFSKRKTAAVAGK